MADKTKDLAVYVADHDGGYLDLVRVQLENAGMRVKTFGKRRDLMEQLEADLASGSLPRVLLLSALLPDGSGLELSKKLKEHRKLRAIIIAIVSAVQRGHRFSVEARTRFLADHYLEQPLDYKAIPEIVSKIAEGASAESFEEEAKTKMDAGASEAKTETPTRGRRAGRKDKTPPNGSAKRTPAADGAIDDNIRRAAADAAARYSGTGGRAQPTRREQADEIRRPDDAGAPREKAPRIKRERPAKPDVPASGRVGDVLFPELLLSFYEKRATGTLFIRTGGEERRLSIRNGIPVSIDSNFIAGQSLGAILLEQERISDAQLFHAQKIVAESGQRLGEVLIESGLIDAQELVATLHYQAQRKLMSAFPHDEGEYEFRDGAPDVGDSGHLDESILQILLAGVKNYCTMALLESRIYANRHRVVQKGDVQAARRAGLQLTRQEWAILDLVDGQRTLGDIVSRTPLNFIRTFQVLYLFFLFGLVRFSDGGSDFFQLDEPVLNRALSEARSDATPAPLMPPAVAPPQETESDLLRLLYRLSGLRADGVVIARAGGAMHRIVLSAGKPVKIASEVANALSVGNLLVARGRLTEEDRDRALELAGSEGLPIGEALLKLGLLSPHELYEVLVTQAEERLMALTTDARAVEIQYEARRTEEPRGLPLDVDLVKVLVRAMRLRIKPEHARDELAGDAGKAVAFTASGRARLHPHAFDAKESSVITLIDGRRTLKQIREHSGLGSDETNTLVFALLKLGLIEFLGEG